MLLASAECLTAGQLRSCRVGQRFWWLRRHGGGFIALPPCQLPWWRPLLNPLLGAAGRAHRADRPLRVEVDLPPGRYTLGCGTLKSGIRRTFTV